MRTSVRISSSAQADEAAPVPPDYPIAATTPLAVLTGSIPSYAYPGGPATGVVPGTWYGYQTILPIVAQYPGWDEVRLAQRPNQSVTWVEDDAIDRGSTPFHLLVDLGTRHLFEYDSGRLVASFPAGIGTPQDPTPIGAYFVAMTAPAPNAGYGPFMLVTSDHSDTIVDYDGGGDAIIGIHGPVTAAADAAIGSNGAAISLGCVRLHNADLASLADIPPGTPLDIVP